jgi:uncharacterized protein
MKLRLTLLALAAAVALRAAESLPLFNATLTTGKEHRFVLVSPAGKASSFLALGETFEGYKLKSYDPKTGVLELERDGKISRVTLVADAAVAHAAATATRATIADATAVLNAMHFEKMIDRTLEGVKRQQQSMMEKMSGQMAGPGTNREELVAFQKKMVDEMMSAISGAEMKAEVARVYSEVFSKEELQGLANFYASPVGEAFSDKQPLVAEKMQEHMMTRMMAMMPKVQQMGREFAAAQKAKRDAAAGGAAPPPAPKP